MSDLEKKWQELRDNAIRDPEKILEYMTSHSAELQEPFVLEVLYEPGELIIIQGNLEGLKSLQVAVNRLIETSAIGGHIHFDNASNLSKSEIPLIIQKVDDDGEGGAHKIR
jgi:hypothetical protein